ncbi:MAG: diguanylate cyclase [Deltaproteobacteria bacterium]|nr:diguanylate cyclase [Deltaproteobacteria bacterium]
MKITINRKITGLFSVGIIIFAIFAGSTFFVIKTHQEALHRSNIISKKVELTGYLQLQVDRLLLPVNRYLITRDIKERDNFDSIINEMSNIFAELKIFSGDKRWQGVAEKVEKDAINFGEKAVDILYIDKPVGNKDAQKLTAGLTILSEMLVREAEEFHTIAGGEMKKMEEDAERNTRRSSIYTVIGLGASVFSALLLYYYLRRSVTAPLHQLYEGAGIIAKGNLQHRLIINTGDELEELASAFNNMSSSLGEARKELDRRIFELFTLYNISKVLSTTFETEALLKGIVDNVGKGLEIDRVMIMLIDDQKGELYIASYTDFIGEGMEKMRFKIGEGAYGFTAATGEPRLIREVDKDASIAPEERFDEDVNSIIIVPFGVKGKVLGLLNVFKNRPQVFDLKDMELMTAVAEHVALALENARLYKETKLMAITDGLTGLYNHRFFIQKVEEEVKRALRYNHPLSLIMMDIDYFKRYNDTHGHQMGDALLRIMAGLLKTNLRNTDMAARYGGEEFAVLLTETDKQGAVVMAERIRKTVEEYIFPHEESQPGGDLTISLGVASLNVDAKDADGFVKRADDALYRAKETGRNRVVAA